MDVNQIASKEDVQVILDRLIIIEECLRKQQAQPVARFLNQKEAAKLLSISPNTFRRKVLNGEIPSIEVCKGIYRYSYDDICQNFNSESTK